MVSFRITPGKMTNVIKKILKSETSINHAPLKSLILYEMLYFSISFNDNETLLNKFSST